MRHRVKGRKLGRTTSHRLATLRALATSLLIHKKIKTTLAKAKSLRSFIEPIITKARDNNVHARRYVARHIHVKKASNELFNEIVPKVGDRPGGYTRVIKLGQRLGDAAEMAIIELVDYNELIGRKQKEDAEAKAKVEGKDAVVEDAEIVEEKPKTKKKAAAKKEEKETEKKAPAKKTTAKKTTAKKAAEKKTADKKEEKEKTAKKTTAKKTTSKKTTKSADDKKETKAKAAKKTAAKKTETKKSDKKK